MVAIKRTRIQAENRERILSAALEVFARDGFRGATVDVIAAAAGMSKPNMLYYFQSKDSIYRTLLEGLLDTWLAPLRDIDADGDPLDEIGAYIERKIEMSRDLPLESRLFANEMMRGAPILQDIIETDLKEIVDEKAEILRSWAREGRIAAIDAHHLIFAIWATTQHYADFDVQVRAVLGESAGDARFEAASRALKTLFLEGLRPR